MDHVTTATEAQQQAQLDYLQAELESVSGLLMFLVGAWCGHVLVNVLMWRR